MNAAPDFAGMTAQDVFRIYTAIQAAGEALLGIRNRPYTDTTDASGDWIETEEERLEDIVEKLIIPLARSGPWPEGRDSEEHRLNILLDFATRVDDAELDREVAEALLRFCAGETVSSTEKASDRFDRKAVAGKAHDTALLAGSLVCALRGAEERQRDGANQVGADFLALGALATALHDRIEEVAGELHG